MKKLKQKTTAKIHQTESIRVRNSKSPPKPYLCVRIGPNSTNIYDFTRQKQVQAKSDLSKQIAETAKKCLGVNISGKDVSESIISRPAPPLPAPFVLNSTLVEKKKAPLFKASTVLNKATPQLVTPSSNSSKF